MSDTQQPPLTAAERAEIRASHFRVDPENGDPAYCAFDNDLTIDQEYPCLTIRLLDTLDAAERQIDDGATYHADSVMRAAESLSTLRSERDALAREVGALRVALAELEMVHGRIGGAQRQDWQCYRCYVVNGHSEACVFAALAGDSPARTSEVDRLRAALAQPVAEGLHSAGCSGESAPALCKCWLEDGRAALAEGRPAEAGEGAS